MMTKEQVIAAARTLSIDDRAEIMAAIDPAAESSELTDAMRTELDRRIAAHDADPSRGIPWEQLKAQWAAER